MISTSTISEHDLQFLVSFGDTDQGFIARAECAEMAGIPAQVIDDLVLRRIYREGNKK